MATKTPLTDVLAKELGYKDAKELRRALSDRDKGSLKERLESGQGFREAITGSFAEKTTDIKETFTKKGVKKFGRKAYREFFSGQDIFSSYMRGRLRKKERKELESSGAKEGEPEKESGGGDSAFTKIIAKESMMLPGMARDMNVMRQNIQKLVKLWGGNPATSKEKNLDSGEKLPQEEIDKISAEVDAKNERKGDINYFAEQDKREADLEAAKAQSGDKSTSPTPEKKEEKEPGLLDSIMSMFSGGFMKAIKSLFSPKMLMKFFSKIFLPAVIIGTLFSGIIDGFKKYQETGSFSEAIISGLGGMLKFLTFGIFGEDTIRNLFDSISNFLTPITDTISEIFTGIKNFFIKMFGGQVKVEDKSSSKMAEVKPSDKSGDFKSFGEGAAKAAGKSDEQSKDIGKVFGTIGTGDFGKTLSAAQEYAKKYPEQRQETTTPTPTKSPAPVSTAPTPISEMSDLDKVKQLEGYIENNKKAFAKRQEAADRHVASLRKRYPDQPDKVKEIEDDYKEYMEKSERPAMEKANAEHQRQIDEIKKSNKGAVTTSIGSSPAIESGKGSGTAASASGVLGSSGETGAGGVASMVSGGSSAPSGAEMSQASSQVAEGQRMESTADVGSVINAPTNNNSSPVMDKTRPQTVNVYNEELAKMLAVT